MIASFCFSLELSCSQDLIETIRSRVVQVNLSSSRRSKTNLNIQHMDKQHRSSPSSTLVINKYSLIFIGLGMKNNGGR